MNQDVPENRQQSTLRNKNCPTLFPNKEPMIPPGYETGWSERRPSRVESQGRRMTISLKFKTPEECGQLYTSFESVGREWNLSSTMAILDFILDASLRSPYIVNVPVPSYQDDKPYVQTLELLFDSALQHSFFEHKWMRFKNRFRAYDTAMSFILAIDLIFGVIPLHYLKYAAENAADQPRVDQGSNQLDMCRNGGQTGTKDVLDLSHPKRKTTDSPDHSKGKDSTSGPQPTVPTLVSPDSTSPPELVAPASSGSLEEKATSGHRRKSTPHKTKAREHSENTGPDETPHFVTRKSSYETSGSTFRVNEQSQSSLEEETGSTSSSGSHQVRMDVTTSGLHCTNFRHSEVQNGSDVVASGVNFGATDARNGSDVVASGVHFRKTDVQNGSYVAVSGADFRKTGAQNGSDGVASGANFRKTHVQNGSYIAVSGVKFRETDTRNGSDVVASGAHFRKTDDRNGSDVAASGVNFRTTHVQNGTGVAVSAVNFRKTHVQNGSDVVASGVHFGKTHLQNGGDVVASGVNFRKTHAQVGSDVAVSGENFRKTDEAGSDVAITGINYRKTQAQVGSDVAVSGVNFQAQTVTNGATFALQNSSNVLRERNNQEDNLETSGRRTKTKPKKRRLEPKLTENNFKLSNTDNATIGLPDANKKSMNLQNQVSEEAKVTEEVAASVLPISTNRKYPEETMSRVVKKRNFHDEANHETKDYTTPGLQNSGFTSGTKTEASLPQSNNLGLNTQDPNEFPRIILHEIIETDSGPNSPAGSGSVQHWTVLNSSELFQSFLIKDLNIVHYLAVVIQSHRGQRSCYEPLTVFNIIRKHELLEFYLGCAKNHAYQIDLSYKIVAGDYHVYS